MSVLDRRRAPRGTAQARGSSPRSPPNCDFLPERVGLRGRPEQPHSPAPKCLTAQATCGSTLRMSRDLGRDRRSWAGRARRAPLRRSRVALAAIVALLHGPVLAQIYSGAGPTPESSVVLSNFPSASTPVLLIAAPDAPASGLPGAKTDAGPASSAPPAILRLPAAPPELKQLIAEVAAEVRIAPELLHAVIAAESSYDSRAKSPKGAIGLMQLLPATALRFGASDPYVARQNVLAGASYLKWLMAMFQDDLELVLAAYNAGEQAVLRAGGKVPPFAETRAYVPRVLAYLRCARSITCSAS